MVQFVVASKASRDRFLTDTALGSSIGRLSSDPRLSIRLWSSNTRGLSELYNIAIDAPDTREIVVFVHDDIWIEDHFTLDRVIDGLRHFDVIGLAGGPYKAGRLRWGHVRDGAFGAVGHGRNPLGPVTRFGPTPHSVDLLDGLFIAAKTETLRQARVRFDEAFRFHFYDLDFSLTARQAGLRLGVWPISVTHQSRGNFDGPDWKEASEVFARKWSGVELAAQSDVRSLSQSPVG